MNKVIITVFLALILIIAFFGVYSYNDHPKDTVRIGYLANDQHSSALTIANVKGMFEEAGINVELQQFNVGSNIVIAMAAGQIDIGYVGTAPATMAIDKGMPLKIVAAVNEEGSGIVIAQNSTIKNITDFENHIVCIPSKGSIQDILLNYLLQENNISPKDIDIREMQLSLMPEALQSGRIDGYVIWEPYVTRASSGGYGKTFMYSDEIWKNHPCCVIIASDNFRQNNPDKLKKILKIHKNATDYIYSNRDDAASILSKQFNIDINTEKEILKHIKFLAIPDEDFIVNDLKIVNIQRQLGYVDHKTLNTSDIFDLSFLPPETMV
ncbi:MAG: ABC transporter substrate-binding protein [Methanobacterium sp.]|uniref:ABC transporter substrate-binding protein n=1 Tax=Methanobacterium sp. TaxID=2164 RepID=UPI003D64BB71|nr:ABC transporter substrate-binding protein [Methanobacterium sp.]